jgi:hypothetical protein
MNWQALGVVALYLGGWVLVGIGGFSGSDVVEVDDLAGGVVFQVGAGIALFADDVFAANSPFQTWQEPVGATIMLAGVVVYTLGVPWDRDPDQR